MPYPDERAGLAAIREIVDSTEFERFRSSLQPPSAYATLPLPVFRPCPAGTSRSHLVAIDGSRVYDRFPGRLPDTHIGAVALGVVIIKLNELANLERLPESGAVDPRLLRATEIGRTRAALLPGMNARSVDGLDALRWFRECVNNLLVDTSLGGESFADTLYALLGADYGIHRCPNSECGARDIATPPPKTIGECDLCGTTLFTSDVLRIHEQFTEHRSTEEPHSRVMDTLEILALANSLRHLAETDDGLDALRNTAFVMDGQLAAMGTIAVLARAMRDEVSRIQQLLESEHPGAQLLILSGVKTGPFVRHAEEIDRDPAPNRRIPPNRYWMPDNAYIRKSIVAGQDSASKPWGQDTHYGRPLVLKTSQGQRLVLNIAQPEAAPPLTDRPPPRVLADAIATAAPLGLGTDQFLALRRAHRWASIPLKAGEDLIQSLLR